MAAAHLPRTQPSSCFPCRDDSAWSLLLQAGLRPLQHPQGRTPAPGRRSHQIWCLSPSLGAGPHHQQPMAANPWAFSGIRLTALFLHKLMCLFSLFFINPGFFSLCSGCPGLDLFLAVKKDNF